MQWKLWLAQLALAVLPTLLRAVSKLAAAMAQAIEQLKAAAGTATSTVGQAPSGKEPGCLDCMQDKDRCPDCTDGDLYVSPDTGGGYGR